MTRVVLCMKWGTKYGPEYVNRLYAMVRRHLRGEFQFVCLTDSSEGIRKEVRCLPIPDLALPEGIPERGWKKLTTFEADLHGLRGVALFLDIDIVIVDDITPFFELPGEFLIIHHHITCSFFQGLEGKFVGIECWSLERKEYRTGGDSARISRYFPCFQILFI